MSWLLINRKWHFKRSDLSSVAHRLEPGLLPRYLPDSMSAWRRLSKTNHQSGQQAPVWSDQGKKINKIKIKNPGEKKKKKLPKTVETISGNCSEKTASRSFFSLPPQSPQSRSRAQLWRNWRLCWKLLSDARSPARPPSSSPALWWSPKQSHTLRQQTTLPLEAPLMSAGSGDAVRSCVVNAAATTAEWCGVGGVALPPGGQFKFCPGVFFFFSLHI